MCKNDCNVHHVVPENILGPSIPNNYVVLGYDEHNKLHLNQGYLALDEDNVHLACGLYSVLCHLYCVLKYGIQDNCSGSSHEGGRETRLPPILLNVCNHIGGSIDDNTSADFDDKKVNACIAEYKEVIINDINYTSTIKEGKKNKIVYSLMLMMFVIFCVRLLNCFSIIN